MLKHKFKTMHRLILAFFIISALWSCTKTTDEKPFTYDNEQTIYSYSNQSVLREILFIIKPFVIINQTKKYLLTDTLYNIKVEINNKPWGTCNSIGLDTSIYTSNSFDNLILTNDSVKFPVICKLTPTKTLLTTAGEYSDLLNNFFTLEPGFYFCSIRSFDIKTNTGETKTYKANIVVPIEVTNNTKSLFLGEFEVLLERYQIL